MHKFLVSFDRTFTEGLMSGVTIRSSVRCADWQAADSFAKSCDGKLVKGVKGQGSKHVDSAPIIEAIEARDLPKLDAQASAA